MTICNEMQCVHAFKGKPLDKEVSSVWITAVMLSNVVHDSDNMYLWVSICAVSFENQKAAEEERYTVLKRMGRTRLTVSFKKNPYLG